MSTAPGAATDNIETGRNVLEAARSLRDALNAEPGERQFAVDELQAAARSRRDPVQTVHEFMFVDSDTPAAAAQPSAVAAKDVALGDALAAMVTDLHVANVLLAAGQSMGETGVEAPASKLDEAILSLDTTVESLEHPSTAPGLGDNAPTSFAFMDDVASLPPIASADVDGARGTLRTRERLVISALVSGSREVAMKAIEKLSKLPLGSLLEAVSGLGKALAELPRIGTLIAQGMDLVNSVRQAWAQLVSSEALSAIKDRLKDLIDAAKEGKGIDGLLELMFGKSTADALADAIVASPKLNEAALDKATNELGQLAMNFRRDMQIASGLLAGVTATGLLLGWIPGAGPAATAGAAGLNVLILASVVLIGLDYADSQPVLHRVRGVQEILRSVGA